MMILINTFSLQGNAIWKANTDSFIVCCNFELTVTKTTEIPIKSIKM